MKLVTTLSSPSGVGRQATRPIRAVVVDDSYLARRALVTQLPKFAPLRINGLAENAVSGFALAAEIQPDLVITDLQMPGLNGFQFVELLRRHYPAIKSIIISTEDGPALQTASLKHGADAFICKLRLAEEMPGVIDQLFFRGS